MLCPFHVCMQIIRIKHVTRECLQRPQKKKKNSARSGSILLFVSFASLCRRPQDHGLPFSLPESNSSSQMRSGGSVEVTPCTGRGTRLFCRDRRPWLCGGAVRSASPCLPWFCSFSKWILIASAIIFKWQLFGVGFLSHKQFKESYWFGHGTEYCPIYLREDQ